MSKRVHGSIESTKDTGIDPYLRFIKVVPRLAQYAREAAELQALNHRGFHVGAAGEVVNPATSMLEMYGRGSTRPNKSKEKVCAEQRLMGKFDELGVQYIPGIVVAGPSDPFEIATVTNVPTPTLHPCSDRCLGKVLVGHDDMLVVTTGVDEVGEGIYQANLVGDLRKYYSDNNRDALMANVRTFDDWDARENLYLDLKRAERTVKRKARPDHILAVMALNAE